MWDENAPLELLKEMPKVLTVENLCKIQEVIDKKLGVMDLEAIEMCMNNNIKIVVCNINDDEVLTKIFNNIKVGTMVC